MVTQENLGALPQTPSSPEGSRSVYTAQQQQDESASDVKGK